MVQVMITWRVPFWGMMVCFLPAFGMAGEVVDQGEMVVYGESTDMTNPGGPAYAATSLLEDLPDVTVSSQGGPGGQYDLSIRGSAFSGAGLSVNGLSFNHAQTEHFNAELPLAPGLFAPPVVVSGFEQTLTTEGYLVGTVDLQLKPLRRGGEMSAGMGEHESYWLRGQGVDVVQEQAGQQTAVGVFGDYERFNQVNYDDNDNETKRGGAVLQWRNDDAQADLLGGYQEKEMGARGYYGVNPDFPATEKLNDYLFLGSFRKGNDKNSFSASAAFRTLKDY